MIQIRTLPALALLGIASVAHADITHLTDGTVDLLDQSSFSLPGHGQYVDLDGSSGQSGHFSTTEAFAPGTYTLAFDLAGSQRGDSNDVVVSFGDYVATLTRQSNDPFSTETATVTLATSAHLSFYNPGDDNVGALLDNVDVQPVPEPASLAVLGLGGLTVLRRRRK